MNWLRYKKIYFLVSVIAISISTFSLVKWGVALSVDFRGGSVIEYSGLQKSSEEVADILESQGLEVASIQETQDGNTIIRMQHLTSDQIEGVTSSLSYDANNIQIENATPSAVVAESERGSEAELVRFETVGPSIGPELIRKTVYAIVIASLGILVWVAYQFKSFKFGSSAILAMFHDSLILVGSFSLLGYFYGVEIDFLFVTAVLTTLSFSVHDTIVVFDRIREIQGKGGSEVIDTANRALSETMVRSLNNSFTIIFMLAALLLLGGVTIRWFATALLIGTILGTYSSPFVAVPLLVSWDEFFKKVNKEKILELIKRK